MEETTTTLGLLGLPRELRDVIYFYVLEYVAEPPENPSFPGRRHIFREIMYPKRYVSFSSNPSALLVCRQLRDELNEMISSPRTKGIAHADLDIMVKGYMYYPSWTYIPPWLPRGVLFNLNVNLRIFSTESFRGSGARSQQSGSGFRSLMALLSQLVQDGPAFYYSAHRADAHRPFLIHRLSVRISFHDHYTPATHPDTTHMIFRMLKALAVDGVAGRAIKVIHAHAEYVQNKELKVFENEWEVSDQLDSTKAREWGSAGFYYAALVC